MEAVVEIAILEVVVQHHEPSRPACGTQCKRRLMPMISDTLSY